jgi:LAS superfamily LD-carboxypeptidase LdcB
MGLFNYNTGQLNSMELPKVDKNYNNNSAISTLKNVAKESFSSNAFVQQGPLYAICLRVEPYVSPPPDSWVNNVMSTSEIKDKSVWLSVRARIPELHAHIPDPLVYGDTADGKNKQFLEMHPLFLSLAPVDSDYVDNPTPGDIIQVDFQDRVNMTQPVYIKRVSTGEIKAIGETAKSKFNELFSEGSGLGINGGTSGTGRVYPAETVKRDISLSNQDEGPCKGLTESQRLNQAAWKGVKVNGKKVAKCVGIIELVPITGNSKRGLRPEAAASFEEMVKAAATAEVSIAAGANRHTFRSYQDQLDLYNDPKFKNVKVARPGTSNHQIGLAVDIVGAKNSDGDIYKWLKANAKKYHFVQKVASENWHWVYTGQVSAPKVIKSQSQNSQISNPQSYSPSSGKI